MHRSLLKVIYICARSLDLFDLPVLRTLKNKVYERYWDAAGIRVLANVMIANSHPNPESGIRFGHGIELGSFVHLDYSGGLYIGNNVTISEGAKIYTHNHTVDKANIHWREQPIRFSALRIEDDVWIGTNSVILESCNTIGRGAIVGAGAVVTKDVPPYAVVVGNPARVVKYRD